MGTKRRRSLVDDPSPPPSPSSKRSKLSPAPPCHRHALPPSPNPFTPSQLRSPPRQHCELAHDPHFGEKVCAAWRASEQRGRRQSRLISKLRQSLRRAKYGDDIAKRFAPGDTPPQSRERYQSLQEQLLREAEEAQSTDDEAGGEEEDTHRDGFVNGPAPHHREKQEIGRKAVTTESCRHGPDLDNAEGEDDGSGQEQSSPDLLLRTSPRDSQTADSSPYGCSPETRHTSYSPAPEECRVDEWAEPRCIGRTKPGEFTSMGTEFVRVKPA